MVIGLPHRERSGVLALSTLPRMPSLLLSQLWSLVLTELTCILLGFDLVISRPSMTLLHCQKGGAGSLWLEQRASISLQRNAGWCLLQEAVGIPEHGSGGGRKLEGSFQKLEHCVMVWYSRVRSKKMAWHLWGVAVERG